MENHTGKTVSFGRGQPPTSITRKYVATKGIERGDLERGN